MSASVGPSVVEITGLILTALSLFLSTTLSVILFRLVNRRGMAYDILEERIALINTRDGHFIRIKLWNSGSVPILDEDHDVPIIFNFGKRAEVVRVNCFATDPPTLNAHLNKDSGNAILEKPIPKLNGGESITFDVEVHDYDKINISSHITWIKKIIEMPQDLNRGISICIVLTALCGAFF